MGLAGTRGASHAGRAGPDRGGFGAVQGDGEARGLGSRRREAGRPSRPHPPPAAFNGPARTLALVCGRRSVGPTLGGLTVLGSPGPKPPALCCPPSFPDLLKRALL